MGAPIVAADPDSPAAQVHWARVAEAWAPAARLRLSPFAHAQRDPALFDPLPLQAYVAVAQRVWAKLQAGERQAVGKHGAPRISFE